MYLTTLYPSTSCSRPQNDISTSLAIVFSKPSSSEPAYTWGTLVTTGTKVFTTNITKIDIPFSVFFCDWTKLAEIPFPFPLYRHEALDLMISFSRVLHQRKSKLLRHFDLQPCKWFGAISLRIWGSKDAARTGLPSTGSATRGSTFQLIANVHHGPPTGLWLSSNSTWLHSRMISILFRHHSWTQL